MMNRENRNIIAAYAVTICLVGLLIVVIMNVNTRFFPDTPLESPQFTPAARGVVSQDELRFGLFNDAKFRSLRPLLTDAERRDLEKLETPAPKPGENGVITDTVKPTPGSKREVRRSNPFLPFSL